LLTGAAAIALPATGYAQNQTPTSPTRHSRRRPARTQQDTVADLRKSIGRDVPNAANETVASFLLGAALFG
jgi:hypothetical protein